MNGLKTEHYGDRTIVYREGLADPSLVIDQLSKPRVVIKKGRGEIRILSAGDRFLACRKYMHGGLLRGMRKDVFLSEKRAAEELEITAYLEEKGFPVVSPYGYLTEGHGLAKSLYFLTFFEDTAVDLMEFLKSADKRERRRTMRDLARLFFELGRLGIYHPDLHLQNVLVTKTGDLIFLDFDKAYHKSVGEEDMKHMFWRLNRFAEKKEKTGELVITTWEKTLFLRIFERLSGLRIMKDMATQLESKRRSYKLGWLLDSFLYRKNRQTNS